MGCGTPTTATRTSTATTSASTTASGSNTSSYWPYGGSRASAAASATDRLFTGQRKETGIGLYDYGARYYDPAIGRWISPDALVPRLRNPQDWNRYAHNRNNPLRYIDPTGQSPEDLAKFGGDLLGGVWEGGRDAVTGLVDLGGGAIGLAVSDQDRATFGSALRTMWDHPGESAGAVWDSVKAPYEEAFASGQPGKAIGRGIADVGLAVVGTKGAGELGSAAKLGTAGTATRVGLAAGNGRRLVRLYRAVSKAELGDIAEGRGLRPLGSIEGKWFAESAEDAGKWGERLGGDNTVIAVDFPSDIADGFFRLDMLDRIGPARFAELEQLGNGVIVGVVP